MKRVFILLATLLLIFPLAAQQPDPPPPETGSIEGVVLKAATDQNGRFLLQGIAPGAQQDPDFRRPFERDAESLRIKAGAQQILKLKIIPSEKTRFQ